MLYFSPFQPVLQVINRPSVAGAVLKELLSVIHSVSDLFSPDLCVSLVKCNISHVTYFIIIFFTYIFFLQFGGPSWWRVCYQWGLACLVTMIFHDISMIFMVFTCYLYFAHAELIICQKIWQIWKKIFKKKKGGGCRIHGTRFLQFYIWSLGVLLHRSGLRTAKGKTMSANKI